jgi:hypothetical protein
VNAELAKGRYPLMTPSVVKQCRELDTLHRAPERPAHGPFGNPTARIRAEQNLAAAKCK